MRQVGLWLCIVWIVACGGGGGGGSGGASCNMANGQGCLCTDTQACPGGAICAHFPATARESFCSHPCTAATAQADCAFTGVGSGDCIWLLDTPQQSMLGCGIRCSGQRGCPGGFAPMDVRNDQGQTFCACLPN